MVVGGLAIEPSCFSRNHFLMELVNTHTISHLYTEVSAFSSQMKLTLRGFNFHSVGTPQSRGPMSLTIAKTKEK